MRFAVRGHRRRLVLAFLVAGVPCLVLLVLASRMLQQERELLETREHEDRARFASAVADRIRQRLDRVRLEAAAGLVPDPAPALIAMREGASIRLPWVTEPSFAPWPESAAVHAAIARGERAELVQRMPRAAAGHYREAAAAAATPAEKGYATLLLARALERAGEKKRALDHYLEVAALGLDVHDDQGIPLSLYALEHLATAGSEEAGPLARRHLQAPVEISPAALHLLRDIADAVADPALSAMVDRRLDRIDRGLRLQRDIHAILPPSAPADRWTLYDDGTWLVGSARIAGRDAVLAVATDDLVRAVVADDPELTGLRLVRGWAGEGIMAGAALPGVGLRLPAAAVSVAGEGVTRRTFLFTAIGLVIATSLFAAALLLRDVRRESETAELRSQFVSSVSHELKTPLSAIRMFAESLQMARPGAERRRDEYLHVIVNESERLSRLLDNVLEFSKIERGERRYRLEPRDLGEVVRTALHAAAYPLEQKGFHVDLRIEEGLPPARLDRDAVEQALLNLLTNAMKYSGDARELAVLVERAGDHVALRVVDRGIGIPPQETEKIFEKFYRATNSDQATGAGLGLAIVAHIARSHRGVVEVDSRLGEGSRFTIAFPVEGL